jgi:hypothetical protein
MESASANVLRAWLEVSHLIIRFWTAWQYCKLIVALYESYHRVDGAAKAAHQFRAIKAGSKTGYKDWSAVWKGIESAIVRFCTESGLSVDELFALKGPLSPAIEEARGMVAAVGAADHVFGKKVRKLTYHQLCDAWYGDSKPK